MGADPRIFDDIAKVAGGALSIVSGMQEQFRDEMRSRVEEMAARMDLVPREDFDLALARIEKLQKRVDALETRLDGKTAKKPVKKAPVKAKRAVAARTAKKASAKAVKPKSVKTRKSKAHA